MDLGTPQRYDELRELVEDNNRMLRRLTRALAWSRTWGFFKWLIIIGSTLGVYYYFQDEFQSLLAAYQQSLSVLEEARSTLGNFKLPSQ